MLKKVIKVLSLIAVNIFIFVALVVSIEYVSSFYADTLGGNLITVYRLNHMWHPNTERIHREWVADNPEFSEPFTHVYNSQGWLETYDIDPIKTPDTYRIFYLGDSFTEGTLPMDQSVPSVVEQQLNQLTAGKDIQFEVINTGTASYSPTIFYVLTRYVLMDYAPDLIVVNIDMTDDFDDWKYAQTLIRDEADNPWAVPRRSIYEAPFVDTAEGVVEANIWTKGQLFLVENSYTYNLIRKYIDPENATEADLARKYVADTDAVDPSDGQIYQRWAWCQYEWDEFTEKNVEYTLDILRRLIEFTHQNQIKIMITSVPHYWQYAGDVDGSGPPRWSSRPHNEIAELAKENGVPYLNSYEALKPVITGTPQTEYYYHNDMHFNPRGYQVWTQVQLEFLIEKTNQLLPDAFYN